MYSIPRKLIAEFGDDYRLTKNPPKYQTQSGVTLTGDTMVYCYYVPALRKLFFAEKRKQVSDWLREFGSTIKVTKVSNPSVAKIRDIDYDLTGYNIKQYIL